MNWLNEPLEQAERDIETSTYIDWLAGLRDRVLAAVSEQEGNA